MSTPSLKEQNLQSSLLFMQQDHAKTLKGLHDEINRLQSKCKDLTFQLAMETTSTSQEDYYRTKYEEKEGEVVKWRTKAKELEEVVTDKDAKISQLQKRVKRLEYKHLEELKSKAEALQRAQAELLSKSEEISTLQMTARTSRDSDASNNHHVDRSHELSRNARRLSSGSSPRSSLESPRSSQQHSRHRRFSCDSDSLESVASSSSGQHSHPHPPTQLPHHRSSAHRRSLNLNVINRPASGRKLVEDDSLNANEEATAEILEITKSQRLSLQGSSAGSTSKLLPPIPPTAPPPRLHKANSAAFSRRKPPTEPEPVKVETLAIDQVNGTRKINLRRAQEFNSQDGP